jgi:hypothetical protein
LTIIDGGRSGSGAAHVTRAEARALKRGAPLAHARLKAHLAPITDPPPREA